MAKRGKEHPPRPQLEGEFTSEELQTVIDETVRRIPEVAQAQGATPAPPQETAPTAPPDTIMGAAMVDAYKRAGKELPKQEVPTQKETTTTPELTTVFRTVPQKVLEAHAKKKTQRERELHIENLKSSQQAQAERENRDRDEKEKEKAERQARKKELQERREELERREKEKKREGKKVVRTQKGEQKHEKEAEGKGYALKYRRQQEQWEGGAPEVAPHIAKKQQARGEEIAKRRTSASGRKNQRKAEQERAETLTRMSQQQEWEGGSAEELPSKTPEQRTEDALIDANIAARHAAEAPAAAPAPEPVVAPVAASPEIKPVAPSASERGTSTTPVENALPEWQPGFPGFRKALEAYYPPDKYPNGVPPGMRQEFDKNVIRIEKLIASTNPETRLSPEAADEEMRTMLLKLDKNIKNLPKPVRYARKMGSINIEKPSAATETEKEAPVTKPVTVNMDEVRARAAATKAALAQNLAKEEQQSAKDTLVVKPEDVPVGVIPEGTREEHKNILRKLIEKFNWWKSSEAKLVERSTELDKELEKMGGVEKGFRWLGEKYNKLDWKGKLAVGVALGVGGGLTMAAGSAWAFAFVAGSVAQRAAGLATMYMKFETAGDSKEKAMLKAIGYTAAMSAAMAGLMYGVKEASKIEGYERTKEALGKMFGHTDTTTPTPETPVPPEVPKFAEDTAPSSVVEQAPKAAPSPDEVVPQAAAPAAAVPPASQPEIAYRPPEAAVPRPPTPEIREMISRAQAEMDAGTEPEVEAEAVPTPSLEATPEAEATLPPAEKISTLQEARDAITRAQAEMDARTASDTTIPEQPAPTIETPPEPETPAPSIEPPQEAPVREAPAPTEAPSAPTPEPLLQSLVPEHAQEFINKNNISIDPLKGHVFQDSGGITVAYGNDFSARLNAAQEYARANPNASVWVQAEKPIFHDGAWRPWVHEVRYGGFWRGVQILNPDAPTDPSQIGAIRPDTFIRQLDK